MNGPNVSILSFFDQQGGIFSLFLVNWVSPELFCITTYMFGKPKCKLSFREKLHFLHFRCVPFINFCPRVSNFHNSGPLGVCHHTQEVWKPKNTTKLIGEHFYHLSVINGLCPFYHFLAQVYYHKTKCICVQLSVTGRKLCLVGLYQFSYDLENLFNFHRHSSRNTSKNTKKLI